MRVLFFIIALIPTHFVLGQAVFQRSYGGQGSDYGRAVIECSNDGYLVVGSTNSFINESTDIYLLRVDEAGEFLWGKNIGFADQIEWGVDLKEDAEGNFIIAGYTDATPSGTYDGFIVKTNPAGNVLWQKTYGSDDWDFFESMTLTSEGNILICGQKMVDGNPEGWLLLTSPDGTILWETLIPGNGNVKLTGMDICESGVIVFTGYIENTLLSTKKQVSGSLTVNGDIIWASTFAEFGRVQTGKCICSESNEILTVATNYNDENESHLFFESINSANGIVNWSRSLSNPGSGIGNGISLKSNMHILLAGALDGIISAEYSSTSYEFKSNGQDVSIENPAPYSVLQGSIGEDIFFDIAPTTDGGYVCTGQTTSYGYNTQLQLCKIGPNGERDLTNTDYLDTSTKITFLSKPTQFNIYPNPAKTEIRVDFEITSYAAYEIHDLTGKILKTGSLNSGSRDQY